MSNLSTSATCDVSFFLNANGGHLSVPMEPLSHARVVWVNQRVMKEDPAFVLSGGSLAAYRTHLLRECAYGIATISEQSEQAVAGIVDRYGGPGIGHNGGSGRAAAVGRYYVKGVGRTPMVSALTDEAHASGGAYLEECVREAIFSELAAAELPRGVIPVLAIIDTGAVKSWELEDGRTLPERCCLLVRPTFLRPAHFERAPAFIGSNPSDGYADAQRVEQMFRLAMERWGKKGLTAIYQELWFAWAEQLAYAYVHRLPHGVDSTSNIAFDGRLVDFGGTTAVPSLARFSLTWGAMATGEELVGLIQSIKAHAKLLGRYVDSSLGSESFIGHSTITVAQRYQQTLSRELLRMIGLSTAEAEQALRLDESLLKPLSRIVTHYRREQLPFFAGMPEPRLAWDIDKIWSENCPEHWRGLRREIEVLFCRLGAKESSGLLFRERCNFRSKSRPMLYRDNIKRYLYEVLEAHLKGQALDQVSLDAVIASIVCRNRRDSKFDPSDSVPVGFARSGSAGLALFRDVRSGALFAMEEWGSEVVKPNCMDEARLVISTIAEDRIEFALKSTPDFRGAVCSGSFADRLSA